MNKSKSQVIEEEKVHAMAERCAHIVSSSCTESKFCNEKCKPLVTSFMKRFESEREEESPWKELGSEIHSAVKVAGMLHLYENLLCPRKSGHRHMWSHYINSVLKKNYIS